MKKIFTLLFCGLLYFLGETQVIYGVNNFTQYHVGSLPLVISVPHGGLIDPSTIPDRTCGSPTTVTDSYTIELARQIDTALYNITGCHPHLIICNLKRTKIDCNRNMADGACGNVEAETAWGEFQHFIDTAQLLSENQHSGKTFYMDLHGHGKPILRLELGYGINSDELSNDDTFLNSAGQIAGSSIGNLVSTNVNGFSHAELLRGDFALGTLLANAGFPSVPSQQTPDPDTTAYFYGGYNANTHTCINDNSTINGLQMECHQTVRFGYTNRKTFADSLASILVNYLSIHQNVDLTNNCGLQTNFIPSHLEENSIYFSPNPFSDELQISTKNDVLDFQIQLMNSMGEIVLRNSNENKLNTTHLSPGFYAIEIVKDQQVIFREKVIKN